MAKAVISLRGETGAMTRRLLVALGEVEDAALVQDWTVAHAAAERRQIAMVAARVMEGRLWMEVGRAVRDDRDQRVIAGREASLPCRYAYDPDARTSIGDMGCRVVDADWVAQQVRRAVAEIA